MIYLLQQIFAWLLGAFLLGAVTGWLFQRARWSAHQRDSDEQWRRRLRDVTNEHDTRMAALSAELEAARDEFPVMEQSLLERSNLIAELESRLARLTDDVPALEDRLASQETELVHRRAHEIERARELSDLLDRVDKQDGDLAAVMQDRDARVASERALQNSLETAKSAAQTRQRQLEESAAELSAARRDLESAHREIARLEQDVASSVGRGQRGDTETTNLQGERDAAVAEALELRTALHEMTLQFGPVKRVVPVDPPDWLIADPRAEPDDLKRIRGIGPVLERTLNGLGIYYFQQIARCTDSDIQWLAEQIQTFPDRIRRDAWVDQAVRLCSGTTDSML